MSTYLEEVASRLIAFDTVSAKSNVEAMTYLGDHLDGHGFSVSLHHVEINGVPKANLVAVAGPTEPNGLAVSGHVDTVPFEGQPGWQRDPLQLEIGDEWIYGRGVSDMKGFVAQCVDAAAQLDVKALRRPLVFLFTADEETGCLGAAELVPALPGLLGNVPQPDLAWIGEPTSYQIFRAHKGIVYFSVTVYGQGGHSSRPDEGVNAIAVAGKVVEAIGKYQVELRARPPGPIASIFPSSPYTTLNLGGISGGTAGNMIAEACTLGISYRALPEKDPLESYREISRHLAEIDTHDYASDRHQARIEVSEPAVVPPLLTPEGTILERVLREIPGSTMQGGAPFATDGCQFATGGIASLIFGPGDLEQAHQPNEAMRRGAFETGTGLVVSVVQRLCVDEPGQPV